VNPSREAAAWHVTRWGPLGWIETGLRYHMFHALALFYLGRAFMSLQAAKKATGLR